MIKNLNKLKFIGIIILIAIVLSLVNFFLQQNNTLQLKNAKLTEAKKIYAPYETPVFKLSLKTSAPLSLISTVFAADEPNITAKFTYINNKTVIEANVNQESVGNYTITPSETNSFKPGKYTLTTTIKTDGGQRVLTQDFTWGVLALNPNKATYNPGETANIAIAVLNNSGNMVCDADVTLNITKPYGKVEIKTTKNKSIAIYPQCFLHTLTSKPDYATNIKLGQQGTYTLGLSATTANGTYQVQDIIKVSDNVSFDIQRDSATRLYPKNQYPMNINITVNQDYKGTVSETIPQDFAIIKSKQDDLVTDYAAKIIDKDGSKYLT